jgi:Leu/Phe-tRNA-protein transferase
VTPHLAQFGAREVSDAEYQELLAAAMAVTTVWEPFEPAAH